MLWPGRLKWAPVAWSSLQFLKYLICSAHLCSSTMYQLSKTLSFPLLSPNWTGALYVSISYHSSLVYTPLSPDQTVVLNIFTSYQSDLVVSDQTWSVALLKNAQMWVNRINIISWTFKPPCFKKTWETCYLFIPRKSVWFYLFLSNLAFIRFYIYLVFYWQYK